jgi:hypothetical protein
LVTKLGTDPCRIQALPFVGTSGERIQLEGD